MLFECQALKSQRERLYSFWRRKTASNEALNKLTEEIANSPPEEQLLFVLDPCQIASVLDLCNAMGQEAFLHVYYLARTFAYYMHREKMITLGRWPGDPGRKPKIVVSKKSKRVNLTKVVLFDLKTNCTIPGSNAAVAPTSSRPAALPVSSQSCQPVTMTANVTTNCSHKPQAYAIMGAVANFGTVQTVQPELDVRQDRVQLCGGGLVAVDGGPCDSGQH